MEGGVLMSETGFSALSFFFLYFAHSFLLCINICGWLMLALELSAKKGGLVLTAAIAAVKGQGGAAANGQLLHDRSWADCPKLIRERGQEKQIREGSEEGASWELQAMQSKARRSGGKVESRL